MTPRQACEHGQQPQEMDSAEDDRLSSLIPAYPLTRFLTHRISRATDRHALVHTSVRGVISHSPTYTLTRVLTHCVCRAQAGRPCCTPASEASSSPTHPLTPFPAHP